MCPLILILELSLPWSVEGAGQDPEGRPGRAKLVACSRLRDSMRAFRTGVLHMPLLGTLLKPCLGSCLRNRLSCFIFSLESLFHTNYWNPGTPSSSWQSTHLVMAFPRRSRVARPNSWKGPCQVMTQRAPSLLSQEPQSPLLAKLFKEQGVQVLAMSLSRPPSNEPAGELPASRGMLAPV